MRFFVDECLSPHLALDLAAQGHDAIHPLHVGRRGELDHTVKDRCIAEDRVVVTENVGDFKALLSREAIHPGLIALPQTSKARGLALVLAAITMLERLDNDPMNAIVNGIVYFDDAGQPALHPLP
ncbi:MAG TPA: DUF5615 family PIN-like protein [Rhodoblastus sp.]|nr:DUF5615 family PIN-like protein [Rhodoblastus sp.]